VVLKTQVRLLTTGVWLLGVFPGARLIWRILSSDLGANPVEELLHRTGDWALILMLSALAVTPIRLVTRWNAVAKIRRTMGLFGFFYVTAHFLIYLLLDQGLIFELSAIEFIAEDISERPFITVGFAAWLLILPLAITSTRGWIRRLGRKWRLLHRLIYVSTALGVIHFFWKVKADTRLPWLAIGVWVILMVVRALEQRRKESRKDRSRQKGPSNASSVERSPPGMGAAPPSS
jgi:methionine sulfoxide reductase heme-binding subunit